MGKNVSGWRIKLGKKHDFSKRNLTKRNKSRRQYYKNIEAEKYEVRDYFRALCLELDRLVNTLHLGNPLASIQFKKSNWGQSCPLATYLNMLHSPETQLVSM